MVGQPVLVNLMRRPLSGNPKINIPIFLLFLLQFQHVQSTLDGAILIKQVTGEDVNGANLCPETKSEAKCPVNCFRADPVCGVDGVTYWCGCPDASCNGAKVAKIGPCEVGNGGSASLPGQALLLIHIVWMVLLGFSLLLGLF